MENENTSATAANALRPHAQCTTALRKLLLCLLPVAALVGCQTPPAAPPSEPPPRILSSLIRDGKGVPNGRSDSSAPYLQAVALRVSSDPRYGRSAASPIHTGPASRYGHLLYLNALRGPAGEPVTYERLGSCCMVEDKSVPQGAVLLDVYRVLIDGQVQPVLLYVDMYRHGDLRLPQGFTLRRGPGAI